MRFILLLILVVMAGPKPEGWQLFEKVTFKPKYFESEEAYFEVPTFDKKLKSLENTEITLSGYYIPLDLDSAIVISSLPFSTCFFCGGAGPETGAEVQLKTRPKALLPDQIVKVKGKLKLNDSDVTHMNFILKEATLIK